MIPTLEHKLGANDLCMDRDNKGWRELKRIYI